MRHLLALADLYQVRPGQLLDLGCPETTAAARRDVADLLAPGKDAIAASVAEQQRARDGEDLEARIGKVLRRELERLGLGRPAAGAEEGAGKE